MTAPWKIHLDLRLAKSDVEVWTTGALWNEASAKPSEAPSKPSFERWLQTAVASGRLRKVRSGLFLNAVGDKAVSVGAAAGHIKRSAIPSLSWVLEQDWLLNNFGNVVTCVVPMGAGSPVPNLTRASTALGEFRFRALPWDMYELNGVDVAEWRDNRYAHPRATPEKALCDWIYLAASPRSTLGPPPLDMDFDDLKGARLRRLARAMKIEAPLQAWVESKRRYDGDPDVQANASTRGRSRTV